MEEDVVKKKKKERKKEKMPFAATQIRPRDYHIRASQTEKDNYMKQLMWNLFILFMGFSRQECCSGLPFHSRSPT